MLTRRERQYLEILKNRNMAEGFAHASEPLQKPMSVEERKLRSRIRAKCKLCIYELALAETSGLLPDKEMKEKEMGTVARAYRQACWQIMYSERT